MSKKPWPTKLNTAKDLAGFLRRKMKAVGGKHNDFKFKTAERFLADILFDWRDPYEIALVYNAAIDATGLVDDIWYLLDLRAYVRLRRQYAPLQGVAHYVYLAMFADVGADKQVWLAIVEDLEDAIVAKDTATEQALRERLKVLEQLGEVDEE